MSKSRLFAIVGLLLLFCGSAMMVAGQSEPAEAATVEPTPVNTIPIPDSVSGIVRNANGPVAGAIVQIQATTNTTLSADDGTFTLTGLSGTTPLILTAWSDGHYVGWTTLNPSAPDWKGADGIDITLKPVFAGDNSKYEWFSFEGVDGSAACGLCHREYVEWQGDQHSRAAINHRFLNIYMGTDVQGNISQEIAYGDDGLPLPPDPGKPYYGPGFRLDNPSRAGNCATCHTPMASKAPNTQNCAWSGCHTSLTIERANGLIAQPAIPSTYLKDDAAEGISCDFCHKIGDVYIDNETNLPYPDMPGILSLRLHRPQEDQQIFFGTLPDVNRRDTYLPLQSESKFCAGCHFGVLGGVVGMEKVTGGVVVYNSYGEWLESPYSDPETG
ncbi:MAG: hypothetical protein K8I30_18015, partial [Anaerolineae bacterium]|nr:hypothetical protein [Anaerolineae bacterium]